MTAAVVLVRRGEAADRCLASVRAHVPADVEVRETDDVAAAAAESGAADVVAISRPVLVGDGWLDRLRDAAYSDSTVASAAALELEDVDVEAAARLASGATARPRLATGAPACSYVRRAALELAGPLDDGFTDRSRAAGLLRVVAADVPAVPLEDGPLDPGDPADITRGEPRPPNPVEQARVNARRLLDGLSVTIDARALEQPTAGTQVHLVELIGALARTGEARLRVVQTPRPTADAARALDAIDGIDRLVVDDLEPRTDRTHVAHRPHQVTSPDDLTVLSRLGERLVLTHQDLMLFHNPSYHAGAEEWGDYRRFTAGALAAVDLVICFSRHAAEDLLAEDLAERSRVRVVPLASPTVAAGRAGDGPVDLGPLARRPFLLCIGTDLRHKNRLWAIDLLAALRARGWDGALVLAGPHVRHGGTASEEPERVGSYRDLEASVLDLGAVDDETRADLYARAAGVLYPTVNEGFGLVPFEAAAAGTPCFWAPQASLAETLPVDAALVVPWDVEATADRVLGVLRDPAAARALVDRVRDRAAELSWERTARALLAAYDDALRLPPAGGAAIRWRFLEIEARRGEAYERYMALRDEVGGAGEALVGADGLLPDDVQRALAAIARHRPLRAPLFGALRLLHRVATRGRR